MSSELAVIFATHNRAHLIEDALTELAAQEWDGDWEIVLVDNDSTDHTPAVLGSWVEKLPVPTQVVTATERHNISYSRKCGVERCSGESVVFVDDDDLIGPGFVAAMGEALRRHELVGPAHEHHRLNSSSVARFRNFQTENLGEIFGVPMPSGGGFGCRRDLWDRLGGQTESFGYGEEDSDFALRASKLGVRAEFVPDAVYHVRHRGGFLSSFHQSRRLGIARVRIYRRSGQELGAEPETLRRVVRSWLGLVARVRSLTSDGDRLNWAWQLGRRIGRLQGSVLERTWYP